MLKLGPKMALIRSLHKSSIMKKIEKVVTQLPTKEGSGPDSFSGEFQNTLKNYQYPNDN